jgi:DNA-binding MarR family transcriptional regulator
MKFSKNGCTINYTSRVSKRLSATEYHAWTGFLRTHARLMRELDEELQGSHGLPLSSFDVLIQLDHAPEKRLRMRDLADAVVLSRSGLTRLVDRLVREGYVRRERCGEDARGSFAVLTPEGQRVIDEVRPSHIAGVRRRFHDHLDKAELARLSAVWERLQT